METFFQRLEGVLSWYNLLFTGERHERWWVAFLGLVDRLAEKEIQELLTRLSFPEKLPHSFIQTQGGRRSRSSTAYLILRPEAQ